MFCGKCGKELNPEAVFCPDCGAKIDSQPEIKKEEAKAPVMTKKSKKKPIIFGVIAAVLVVGAVASFSYLKNAAVKLFTTPEQYFAYVVSSNFDNIAENFSENIDLSKKSVADGAAADGMMSVRLGDEFQSLIKGLAGYEAYSYISWIDDITLSYKSSFKDNKIDYDMGINLNGVDLASLKMLADYDTQEMYYALPEYNSTYILVDGDPYDYNDNPTEQIFEMIEALPGKKDTKKFLLKCVKAAAESVDDIDEGTKKITAEGVSQQVTCLSFEVDDNTVKDLLNNVLREVKNDKEILKMISESSGMDKEEFEGAIQEAIDSVRYMDVGMEPVQVEVYVDTKGEIVGFAISSYDFEISSYTATKGNKFGTVAEITADGTRVSLEGSGVQRGDKRSGEYSIKVANVSVVDIKTEGVNTKKLEEGIFNGSITIAPSEEVQGMLGSAMSSSSQAKIVSDLSLTIASKTTSPENLDYIIVLNYEDEMCAEIEVKADTVKTRKVQMPDDYVDSYESSEMENWVRSIDIYQFTGKLRDANVPEYFVSLLESEFYSLF